MASLQRNETPKTSSFKDKHQNMQKIHQRIGLFQIGKKTSVRLEILEVKVSMQYQWTNDRNKQSQKFKVKRSCWQLSSEAFQIAQCSIDLTKSRAEPHTNEVGGIFQSYQWYEENNTELLKDCLFKADHRLGRMLQGLEIKTAQKAIFSPNKFCQRHRGSKFHNSSKLFFFFFLCLNELTGIVSIDQENYSCHVFLPFYITSDEGIFLFALATVLGFSLNFVFLKLKGLLITY